MSEYSEILHKAANRPDSLSDSDIAALKRACREYPADAVAAALLLKYAGAELDEEETAFARARVALYCGRPSTLITAIDPGGKGFESFYPPAPAQNRPSTASAIDIFLETYGRQSDEENALLERMIFNPVPDYAEQLAREQEATPAPRSSQDEKIDAFLASHQPEPAHKTPPQPPQSAQPTEEYVLAEDTRPAKPSGKPAKKDGPPSSSLLSQSLAKIFIKQGRFERAYEIISNLSLNYPEKSVYFADQLRFLEKLIINQRYSNRES